MTKAIRPTILALPLLALTLLAGSALPIGTVRPTQPADDGHVIGFEERFALAENREDALEELIPGTQKFYYYSCLHLQSQGKLAEVGPLMKAWKSRHGHRSGQYKEIERRQLLLGFDEDRAGTFRTLARELGLRFDHQQVVPGEVSPLPTQLDPATLTLAAWQKRAKEEYSDFLDGYGPSQWETLAGMELNSRQLRTFLQKLERPDVPNLPALVIRDLAHKSSRGFGSVGIHGRLLLDQLEQCLSLRPDLLTESKFLDVYLKRLLPNADVSWQASTNERLRYLQRLERFTDRLVPAQNSLKSYVLQQRLAHDLTEGQLDKGRFLKFIRIPRQASYANSKYLKKSPSSEIASKGDLHPLGPQEDPTLLVQQYLQHFFLNAEDWNEFDEYLRPEFLRRVFAETKILAGLGDLERWYSVLDDTAYYEQLEQRVEIQFPPDSKTNFAEGDTVNLEVDVKNVDTLLVKVFEIDAASFAMAMDREVDASIDLDGLVAGSETTYSYTEPALRRVRRLFEFPGLSRPGVYVIDFIGGGLSSRSVIHIGQLQLRERLGSAGHVFLVLDESGKICDDATLRLGTLQLRADEDGEIHVPYSESSGTKMVVLQSGSRVGVELFRHRAEKYTMELGVHVERESLMPGALAPLLLRANLQINGSTAHLGLLEDPVLTLRATDIHGTETSSDIRDIELTNGAELLHEFRVPEGLKSLQVSLRGTVKSLSTGKDVVLERSAGPFHLNGIDQTSVTHCPILGRDADGYFVDVLGKNGEPLPNRVRRLEFSRAGFSDRYDVNLKTDAAGRIRLGALPEIQRLLVSGYPVSVGHWRLDAERRTLPSELHGLEGETLRLPRLGASAAFSADDVSLLELRGGEFMADRASHVASVPGYLELRGLPRGDYDLLDKRTGTRHAVRITAGRMAEGWLLGDHRSLEGEGRPLHVLGHVLDAGGLNIELADWTKATRVHVFSTHFAPAFDAYADLLPETGAALRIAGNERALSTYDSGRQIGDEYRYILERRFAKKYPGNMLSKPGLLLNPWAVQDSVNTLGVGGGAGGRFGGRRGGKAAGGRGSESRSDGDWGPSPGVVPNLDFLRNGATVLSNLRPDEHGVLHVPMSDLGSGQHVRVLVTDSEQVIEVQLARAEVPRKRRDRRLRGALAADEHFSEQRRISALNTGEVATMRDTASARATTFDSLQDVFQLFRTLNPGSELQNFATLMSWPELAPEEKAAFYSKHASHELHVFLFHKDPEYFVSVLEPYLANKAEKTFVDHWLLQADLSAYLDPWAFERLNAFEKALLSQRLTSDGSSIARQIRDHVELTPVDPRAIEILYSAALSANAMDTGRAGLTLGEEFRYAEDEELELADKEHRKRAPAAPSAATALDDAPMEAPGGQDDFFLGKKAKAEYKDADRRGRQQLLFQSLARTRQFAEHNYYHQPIRTQVANLIDPNQFWLDYALFNPTDGPFLSPNFVQATGNVAEMLMALAVLDLPFKAVEHGMEREDGLVELTSKSPMILVRKEISVAEEAQEANRLLVGQQYFPLAERYIHVDGQRKERRIEDEFLRGVPYGCRVVVTNPSSESVPFELLMQLPAGSIPLSRARRTQGTPLTLGAYSTHTVEYAFYFPESGEWSHFPAHATRGNQWLAAASGGSLNVVDEPTTKDTSTWEYISQEASLEDVLEALGSRNLLRLSLSQLAWRMRDRRAFDSITNLLESRHTYDESLWSYALHHQDHGRSKEYLKGHRQLVQSAGPWLNSSLLRIDPIERHQFERLEFRPLVRERAHVRGSEHRIYNDSHARQYKLLMDILAHKPTLDSKDWMSVTYHFLLQGRIEEALTSFDRVNPADVDLNVQYEYMRAYVDFFSDEHAIARGIAQSYADHPVPHWRARFAEILRQLDEAEGLSSGTEGSEEVTNRNDLLASAEPSLGIEAAGGKITLQHEHIDKLELRYYVMDVEFLFSTSPFVQENAGSFNFVLPNAVQEVSVQDGQRVSDLPIPAEFAQANVLIEARAAGLIARTAYYSNSMGVQWRENYGQLKVTDAEHGKPLSKVYVKVFRRTPNGEEFHKDGYTDIRGRFDYVSVSGAQGTAVERYAVLVFDESRGAVIRELQPPVK